MPGEEIAPSTTTTVAVFDWANFVEVLWEGWSTIEEGYVWSCQTDAVLHFTLPANREYLIRLTAQGFVAGEVAQQRVAVFVDDVHLGDASVDGFGVIECRVPARQTSGTILRLHLPDARRPCDVNPGSRDDRLLGLSLRHVVIREAVSDKGDATREPYRSQRAPLSEAARAELMARFESLGENCEFGLVQRRCGAEPLGLLRFSSAPLTKLLAALDAKFAGMGAKDNIHVELSSNEAEYMIQDRAFGFYYHAWVKAGEMAPERIHAREAARVPFLVRKLCEDLTEGQKIFVFHALDEMSVASAQRLAKAIHRYGPGTLLWVRLADRTHPAGSTEILGEGLIAGYVDRFAPGNNAHDLSLDAWVDVCQSAVETPVPVLARPIEAARCVPPFALMEQWLKKWTVPDTTRVRAPYDDVLDVLRAMLAIVPVDETWYLAEYPDVSAWVGRVKDESAASHFRKHGYFDGRQPFAEGWQGLQRPVPCKELTRHLRLSPGREGLVAQIERQDFLGMIQAMLRAVRVDDLWYRTTYPGAAADIRGGRYSTAAAHYAGAGYFEGWLPEDVQVDADWYVARYAHVRAGLAAGEATSAKDHFMRIGYGEGCQPKRP